MFGPEWVDRVLIPSLMREEGPLNDYDAFQQKADRVAKMVHRGQVGPRNQARHSPWPLRYNPPPAPM